MVPSSHTACFSACSTAGDGPELTSSWGRPQRLNATVFVLPLMRSHYIHVYAASHTRSVVFVKANGTTLLSPSQCLPVFGLLCADVHLNTKSGIVQCCKSQVDAPLSHFKVLARSTSSAIAPIDIPCGCLPQRYRRPPYYQRHRR
ncbi:hypothetical protein BJV77DRAFT_626685 [Russula vinacea]|nr:hypothetical protein BJV77DRAFT_626685 [Russula vinacea]